MCRMMMNVDDALKPDGEKIKNKALNMHSEEEIILDEDFDEEDEDFDEDYDIDEEDLYHEEMILDEENKEDDSNEDSNAEDTDRMWYRMDLNVKRGLEEQIAFLGDVFKLDESEVQTIHEYGDIYKFYVFVTWKEAIKIFKKGTVCHLEPECPPRIRHEQLKARRKIYTEQKIKKQKGGIEGDCSEASNAPSVIYEPYDFDDINRRWYWVKIKRQNQRDEQIAFLANALKLKCDKSKVRSLHEFCNMSSFHAYLTEEELQKLSGLKMVRRVRIGSPPRLIREQNKHKRKIKARPNFKKQKQSTCSRLSEQRMNKEKWRYDEARYQHERQRSSMVKKVCEDLEQNTAREELGGDYWSSDSDDSCDEVVYYEALDKAGKRCYTIRLVNDMYPDDQMVMLLDTLDCSESEIDSIYKSRGLHHMFGAYVTEEQADRIAGECLLICFI